MSSTTYDPEELLRLKTVRELVRLFPRVVSLIWHVSPLTVCALMFFSSIAALVSPAVIWMTKVIVDRVVESIGMPLDWAYLMIPVGVVLALWIGNAVIGAIDGLLSEVLSEHVYTSASEKLIGKSAELDIAYFEAPKFYDQLKQANDNKWQVESMLWSVMGMFQQLLSLTAMIGLLSILHPLAVLVLFGSVLPRIFLEAHMSRRRFQLQSELSRNMRMAHYQESLLTERETVKEIRIFGLGETFKNRFLHMREKYIQAWLSLLKKFLKWEMSLESLSMMGVSAVGIYAVIQAATGEITIGTLTLVFTSSQQITSMIASIIRQAGMTYQTCLETSRFFEVLDLNPATISGALEPQQSDRPLLVPSRIKSGIEVESVSFSYPGNDEVILKDVSFFIPARAKVALVGKNGAGKTTLIKLLARFYDPNEGFIRLDGRDYREYQIESLQSNMSVVFQDFARFDISAADNIGVGNVAHVESRPRIVDAAKKGGAEEVVNGLPQGYDTILGRTLDEGIDLSGGEWQHLSIARAFMSDAQIFIFDEPTAALDALRERELYERITRLSEDKTVVFISHRFSTVRMADLIVVVDEGTVVEVGSHEELIARGGKYQLMFDTQAQRYR